MRNEKGSPEYFPNRSESYKKERRMPCRAREALHLTAFVKGLGGGHDIPHDIPMIRGKKSILFNASHDSGQALLMSALKNGGSFSLIET